MPSLDETDLITRAVTGDQKAFHILYRTHRTRVTAAVAQRAIDPDDIDDLVQVTFIRAFLSLRRFRGDSSLGTWLTRIAINVCSSHFQSRRLWAAAESIESAEATGSLRAAGTPEDLYGRREATAAAVSAIKDLPERYREAMRLRYLEDCTYPEVVAALGVPLGTVKTWLYRGRELVREAVAGREPM
jgi:RNA polymerase sigma-70 factor (ECF subfamily)